MAAPVKNLGGDIVGPPLLTSWGPKRLDVFHCGTQLGLYHRWRKDVYSGAFSPGGSSWERLSETGHTSITGVCYGQDKIDLFGVRAQENTLDHKWFRGGDGGWRNWESLNPCEYGGSTETNTNVAGDISAVTWGSSDSVNMIVLWRGSDSALHYMTWAKDPKDDKKDDPPKKWWQLTWTEPGKVFVGSPKAVCWKWGDNDRVDVFARDSKNHLLHTNWKIKEKGPKGANDGSYMYLPWEDLGGPILDDPEVVQCTWYENDGKDEKHSINVFARDPGNNVIRRRWLSISEAWAPRDRWEVTGLRAATPPGATAWASNGIGNVAVAALGVDGALHFAKQDGFQPWRNDPSDPDRQSWKAVLVDEGGVPFTHRPVLYHPLHDDGDLVTGDDPVEIYTRASNASVKQILVNIKPKAT